MASSRLALIDLTRLCNSTTSTGSGPCSISNSTILESSCGLLDRQSLIASPASCRPSAIPLGGALFQFLGSQLRLPCNEPKKLLLSPTACSTQRLVFLRRKSQQVIINGLCAW